MYRFAADIFNDAAFVLDCLSPVFPKPTRVLIFSAASMLRALCGVAAGSAKASLSAHFAQAGNLGDVNAVSDLNHWSQLKPPHVSVDLGCIVVYACNESMTGHYFYRIMSWLSVPYPLCI